jgi:hypothetical protein
MAQGDVCAVWGGHAEALKSERPLNGVTLRGVAITITIYRRGARSRIRFLPIGLLTSPSLDKYCEPSPPFLFAVASYPCESLGRCPMSSMSFLFDGAITASPDSLS